MSARDVFGRSGTEKRIGRDAAARLPEHHISDW